MSCLPTAVSGRVARRRREGNIGCNVLSSSFRFVPFPPPHVLFWCFDRHHRDSQGFPYLPSAFSLPSSLPPLPPRWPRISVWAEMDTSHVMMCVDKSSIIQFPTYFSYLVVFWGSFLLPPPKKGHIFFFPWSGRKEEPNYVGGGGEKKEI